MRAATIDRLTPYNDIAAGSSVHTNVLGNGSTGWSLIVPHVVIRVTIPGFPSKTSGCEDSGGLSCPRDLDPSAARMVVYFTASLSL